MSKDKHIVHGFNICDYDLKHIRCLLNMSQSDLADFLFTSVRTVQNWEYRKCCPDAVYSLLWRYYFMQNELNTYKEQVLGQIELKQYFTSLFYINYSFGKHHVKYCEVSEQSFRQIVDDLSEEFEIHIDRDDRAEVYWIYDYYGECWEIGGRFMGV